LPSQQQRFEGPDLETLLDRVRAELGDGVRIVAANRVRRGGLGGFFSREHYEVIVDRDERATALPLVVDLRDDEPTTTLDTAPAPGPAPALSVLELAESVNGTERARESRKSRGKGSKRGVAIGVTATADTVVDLDESVATVDLTADAPAVSTETERFVQILDRIARDVETRDNAERDQVERDQVERDSAERDQGKVRDRGAARAAAVEVQVAHERADRTRQAARATRAIVETPVAGVDHVDDIAIEARLVSALTPAVTPYLPPRVRRGRDLDVIERPENLLARMGLPPRFVPRGVVGTQLRPALIESLAQLPVAAPLPEANGVVIAVIGVGAQPVMLARTLASERGLDPDNLVLATERELGDGIPSWLQITDPGTAEERRRSWRRRDHPTLVAVSVPSVTGGSDWARQMLDRLEPTQTWGIVSAAWKIEDAQAWSDRLGGFDVLALEHVADTVSPAAPIQLDIPIARLDGLSATPLRWAEILTERLAQR
jgi:hypothetical protein